MDKQPLATNPTTTTMDQTAKVSPLLYHTSMERYKRTCNNLGIKVHFKGSNTIKTLLMAPKDRDNKLQKSGVIYRFNCPHINCPEEYIRKSGRTFGDRLKEHLIAPSSIIVILQDTN